MGKDVLNERIAEQDAAEAPDLATLALAWLGADSRPRLIVAADLQVLWSNRPASQQLGDDAGVVLRDGALAFASATAQRDFTDFIEALGEELGTVSIPYPDRSAHLLFRGRRIGVDGRSAACLEFTRDTAGFMANYSDIDRVFSLTRAEHRIVVGLLNGRTASQLATDLLISVDTVRTHVRRIYSKVGVRSREEMFSRLRPYRIL
ncbi:helix-turn-helix transcriptional regulator [Sphingomonas japonica]|uniref:DNA-binding CsgD family transcriptional regulator n=1 Tax=Sphingomonas japonica TaxID=511662 RepID=A0ABX0U5K6_9SPHN|nr:helix-turn-helix transcriptional regulator [Sphingomonas japonica]NIJ24607.1 DNA-binding CsgD family transcriptional regulator [Sphingomonas japonica]